jgi:hypothetical protein
MSLLCKLHIVYHEVLGNIPLLPLYCLWSLHQCSSIVAHIGHLYHLFFLVKTVLFEFYYSCYLVQRNRFLLLILPIFLS